MSRKQGRPKGSGTGHSALTKRALWYHDHFPGWTIARAARHVGLDPRTVYLALRRRRLESAGLCPACSATWSSAAAFSEVLPRPPR